MMLENPEVSSGRRAFSSRSLVLFFSLSWMLLWMLLSSCLESYGREINASYWFSCSDTHGPGSDSGFHPTVASAYLVAFPHLVGRCSG